MRTGSFYEINISKKGQHVFATDSTIRQYEESELINLLAVLGERFPPAEDYEFSVTHWHVSCPAISEAVKAAIPRKERSEQEGELPPA